MSHVSQHAYHVTCIEETVFERVPNKMPCIIATSKGNFIEINTLSLFCGLGRLAFSAKVGPYMNIFHSNVCGNSKATSTMRIEHFASPDRMQVWGVADFPHETWPERWREYPSRHAAVTRSCINKWPGQRSAWHQSTMMMCLIGP